MVIKTFSFPLWFMTIQPLLSSQLIFTHKCLLKCQTPTQLSSHLHYHNDCCQPTPTTTTVFFMSMYALENRKFTQLLPMLTSDYSPRCFTTTLWQVLVSCSYVCCNNNNNNRLYIHHGAECLKLHQAGYCKNPPSRNQKVGLQQRASYTPHGYTLDSPSLP